MEQQNPQRTALEDWRNRMEQALEVDRDDIGVFLWGARSTDHHYETMATGVLRLPVGTDVDAVVVQLREALARITRDWSVGVWLAPRDHDGDPASGGISVSEPWDVYESPDYDLDDGYDGPAPQAT